MLRISLVRLFERDTLAQARDGVRTAAAEHGAKLLQRLTVWNQEVGFLTDDREAGRHHADHRSGPAIGGERHVEHVLAAAKASLPEFVAQHDDRAVATEILLGRVGAAERRPDAERTKDVGGDGEPVNPDRLAADDHDDATGFHHAQMLERSRALAPGDVVGRRDHVPDGAAAVGFPHRHDPIGLTVRQRLQHHRAHHAEDRRGRADAEGQRHQCRGGKARRPSQHASAMTEITHRVFEQRRPDLVPGALPDAFQSAELEQRLAPGLVWHHASAAMLRGLLIDVKTNLFVETALERVAPADRADPLPALCDPSHDASQLFMSSPEDIG